MRKILVRLIASFAIAALLIFWLVQQGFEVLPSWDHIRAVSSWRALLLYTALFSVFHVIRAWRWIYLLRPFARVPSATMMEVAFSGFAAIQMMPLRTGEVARPYLLERYAGVSKSALFGTIAIERVVDGLMVSLWLTAALFTIPATRSPIVWSLRLLPVLLFTVALVLLVAFYLRPNGVRIFLGKVLGLFSQRLASFTMGVLERFHAGLAALPNQRSFWAFVAVSALYWGINALAFYALARECGLELPFVGAVAGMGCLAVGILLPAGPGYFGNFQVAVLTAIKIYMPLAAVSEKTSVFIFLLYVLQTGLTLLYGAGGALRLRGRPVQHRIDRNAVTDAPS